jgi:hypothetical protein
MDLVPLGSPDVVVDVSKDPLLPTEPHARFTLFNLLGQERSWYQVKRFGLNRPAEPVSEQSVAHSIIIIDRSGSMYGWIDDLKETLVKLLTLEEYRNFNLLVTLISYSSLGDMTVHFERTPIGSIMARDSKYIKEIRAIRASCLTCVSQALRKASEYVRENELTAITLHSDGYANDPAPNSESRSLEQIADSWQDRAVFVNTIAYSDYSDFRLLSKIANSASGVCLKAGNIKEVFDSLNETAKLISGKLTPPIEEPLSPDFDYQVFFSRSAGKINGAAGPLFIRGLKPEDDATIYKFRKITQQEFHNLNNVPVLQTSEPLFLFARAQLADGNVNTAKYALASTFDKTMFDKHSRALTNLQIADLACDLDALLFQPARIRSHEVTNEVPVNRKIDLLSLMSVLDANKAHFAIDFDHLRANYVRRGLRRIQGERNKETGEVTKPWLKTELVDTNPLVRISSFDTNRNTANLNILIPRNVKLVRVDNGEAITQVAGIDLKNLSIFNNYTIVGDGELNVPSMKLNITDEKLFAELSKHGVLEAEDGKAAAKWSKTSNYLLRLDTLPLVPPFTQKIELTGVYEQLLGLKILSSLCTAHLKEASDAFTAEQVAELRNHYLSKSLFLNFPTTTEYADLNQALSEGSVDTRTSYKIDIGSKEILNLSKLHSANKCLERLYEVADLNGVKLDKPKFEDCLEGVKFSHKKLSARTKITKVDELMRHLFDDFLGLAANGSAVKVLEGVAGAGELAKIVKGRAKGQQPKRDDFVKALTEASKGLNAAMDRVYAEKISPLVFYIGATGALPDEIDVKAKTADEMEAKYPELAMSKDEREGMFYEIGDTILTVYASVEYFSREKTVSGTANTVPAMDA